MASCNQRKIGKVSINAEFSTVKTAAGYDMTVADSQLTIKSIDTMKLDNGISTLSGTKNQKTAQLQLGVTLADGRQYTGTFSGSKPLFAGMFGFTSSEEGKIELGRSSGTAKLLDNHRAAIDLTGKVCAAGGGLQKTIQVSANLQPTVGDGDLGQTNGVAVPTASKGKEFTVDVRVNTGGQTVKAFNVLVAYEDQDVEFVSAAKAKVAGTVSFDQGLSSGKDDLEKKCNLAGLGKTCVTAAATIDKSTTRGSVVLFSVTFKVKSGARTFSKLSGVVVEMLDTSNQLIGSKKDHVFVAGKLEFAVSGGRRRVRSLADDAGPVAVRPRRATNSIANSLPVLKGDADCNAEFGLGDIVRVLDYVAVRGNNFESTLGKQIKAAVTKCQQDKKLGSTDLSFMDADSNSEVDLQDLTYLLGVTVGNFAFVYAKPVEPTKTECSVGFNTYVATAGGGKPPSGMRVFLDFALDGQNAEHKKLLAQLEKTAGFVTTDKGTTKLNGALVELKATAQEPQVFAFKLSPPLVFSGVGISVIQVSPSVIANGPSWKFFGGKPSTGFATSGFKGHLKYTKTLLGSPTDLEQVNGYNALASITNTDIGCITTTTLTTYTTTRTYHNDHDHDHDHKYVGGNHCIRFHIHNHHNGRAHHNEPSAVQWHPG